MSSLADRVKLRLKSTGLTSADLARAVKVKPPSVADWLSGETKTIKGENLLRAAHALQCSPHWLATGLGPVAPDAQHGSQEVREESVAYMTDPILDEAVRILRGLDRASRLEALQWLRGFAAGRKKGSADSNRHPVAQA